MSALLDPLHRKLARFGPVSAEATAALDDLLRHVQAHGTHSDIVGQGTAPDGLMVVLAGFVGRYKLMENGNRQITAFLVPGDCTELDGSLRVCLDQGVGALTNCQVGHLPADDVRALLDAHRDLVHAFRRSALVDAATLREWVVNLGCRDAETRLAHLICEILERLRVVGLVEDDEFAFPVTQQDLADTAGMSTVQVNRTLQALRGKGLIRLRERRLAVHDLPALRRLAGFAPGYLGLG